MCHMGSDRKMRPTASELMGEFIEKWNTVLNSLYETSCPFAKELEEYGKYYCKIIPPHMEGSVCQVCLANYELCEAYTNVERKARYAVYGVIELLRNHKIIYERHEK